MVNGACVVVSSCHTPMCVCVYAQSNKKKTVVNDTKGARANGCVSMFCTGGEIKSNSGNAARCNQTKGVCFVLVFIGELDWRVDPSENKLVF